ncbi:glycosyltransferase family A protein [Vibrio splendidus]
MSISVIITTYNDSEYLESAINSVVLQDVLPDEILVIDDGSTIKGAKEIVSKFKKSKVNINYFYKENSGPSSARNYGVKKASSEYITFLDADDVWLPNNLGHKINLIESYSYRNKIFGVYGSFIYSDTRLIREFSVVNPGESNKQLVSHVGKEHGIPGGLPSYLINRYAYIDVGGFDENLTINEDFDLIIRFLLSGYFLCGDSSPGFIRTMREESLTRNNNHLLTYSRIVSFLEKAKENDYFSDGELRKRRIDAALSTAKKMIAGNKYELGGYKLVISAFLMRIRFL